MCVPLYVICGCILVSLSLVGCLFAKFTLLSIKRRMISFVFTSKQSGIYFLRKFVSRRNNELPNIGGYKFKVSLKYDTEKFICAKNNTLDIFKKKWTIFRPI